MKYYLLLLILMALSLVGATPNDEAIADLTDDNNYATLLQYAKEVRGKDREDFVALLKNCKDELLRYKGIHSIGLPIFFWGMSFINPNRTMQGIQSTITRLAEWKVQRMLPTFSACKQHMGVVVLDECTGCQSMLPKCDSTDLATIELAWQPYLNFVKYRLKIFLLLTFAAVSVSATLIITSVSRYRYSGQSDQQLIRLEYLISYALMQHDKTSQA